VNNDTPEHYEGEDLTPALTLEGVC